MTDTLSPAISSEIERLVQQLLQTACDQDLKLATAESCTGGLLASLLTDVEGCGHAFDRGFVPYTDAAKIALLGVPAETLRRFTAVSARTAEAMARGALARSNADVVASITGYAGRGAPGEEPGLVFICAMKRGGEPQIHEGHYGDIGRGPVRLECLARALGMLRAIVLHADRAAPARSSS